MSDYTSANKNVRLSDLLAAAFMEDAAAPSPKVNRVEDALSRAYIDLVDVSWEDATNAQKRAAALKGIRRFMLDHANARARTDATAAALAALTPDTDEEPDE